MTIMNPVPVTPAPLSAPSTKNDPPLWSCGCDGGDPDLVRLRGLMAGGMSQTAASHVLWPPPVVVPAPVELPAAITPRPGRHARLLNRWMNREVS